MAFAFIDFQKVKSYGQLNAKYNHNCRKLDIPNVIDELTKNNEDLVPLPMVNGQELSYKEAWQKRIDSLPYYQDHNVRKNAVLAYEVITTFSREENIDLDKWKQKNVEWLEKTFNVAPDKQSNILHMVYHADETGNVHCHALVIPIDERGRLNAKRFTDGSRAMSDLQTSYASSMSEFGLQRGLAGSSARHQDISKMYASLNNAITLPDIKEGEDVEAYKKRVEEDIMIRYAKAKKEIDDKYASSTREIDQEKILAQEAIANQLELSQRIARDNLEASLKEKEKIERQIKTKESYLSNLDKMKAEILERVVQAKAELHASEEFLQKAEFYDKLHHGIAQIEKNDKEEAQTIHNNIEYILEKGSEYERTERSQHEKEA